MANNIYKGQLDADAMRYQREWHDWCFGENLEGLKLALNEEQDIDEIVLNGLTAVSIATLHSKTRLFDFLRESGANFWKLDGNDMNGLMCAAASGNSKMIAKLLSRGDPAENANRTNSKNKTALHFAALKGCVEAANVLVGKGANLNFQDEDGNTPLHYAVKGGSPTMVQLLTASGADETIENHKKQTPAKFNGYAAAKNALNSSESGLPNLGAIAAGKGNPGNPFHGL